MVSGMRSLLHDDGHHKWDHGTSDPQMMVSSDGVHPHHADPHHTGHHHGAHGEHGVYYGYHRKLTPEMEKAQMTSMLMCFALGLILISLGLCWGFYERKRRRRIAAERGGYPDRTGDYTTGIFQCFTHRLCLAATFFSPILAAFNRAEADKRDCNFCDVVFSLKTPITQYQTRQSIRAEHKIADSPVADCLAAVLCTPCAVAQDSIEMERRADMMVVPVAPVVPPRPPTVTVDELPTKGEYSQVPAQFQV